MTSSFGNIKLIHNFLSNHKQKKQSRLSKLLNQQNNDEQNKRLSSSFCKSRKSELDSDYLDKLGYLNMLWKKEKHKVKQSHRKTEFSINSPNKLVSYTNRHSLDIQNMKKESKSKNEEIPSKTEEMTLLCQLMLINKLSPSINDCNFTLDRNDNTVYLNSNTPTPDYDLRLDEKYFSYYPFIFKYLRDRELSIRCNENYLKQNEFTEAFRTLLIDWMIKVQIYCKCRTESLHVAVSLCDSLLSIGKVKKCNYQLLAVACFLIGCKVVQHSYPKLATLCYLTEDCYRPCQIKSMEFSVLEKLEFFVHVPLASHFLHRGLLACIEILDTDEVECLCKFLIELCLLDWEAHLYRPSCKSAAVLCLARYILYTNQIKPWTQLLQHFTMYSLSEIEPCLIIIIRGLSLLYSEEFQYNAVLEKYSKSGWMNVATNENVKSFAKSKQAQIQFWKCFGIEHNTRL